MINIVSGGRGELASRLNVFFFWDCRKAALSDSGYQNVQDATSLSDIYQKISVLNTILHPIRTPPTNII